MNINIDSNELLSKMERYAPSVKLKIERLAISLGKEGVETLKKTSPKRTGKYAKNWKIKKVEGDAFTKIVIYNTNSRLPHLLEKGHGVWNKAGSRTKAQVHIKPVEDEIQDKFTKGVEDILNDIDT